VVVADAVKNPQLVLHVVPVLVGEDVGLRERTRARAEARAELVEEAEVDVDLLVDRAVERAGVRRRGSATTLSGAGEAAVLAGVGIAAGLALGPEHLTGWLLRDRRAVEAPKRADPFERSAKRR
jgi:hypothetical protein